MTSKSGKDKIFVEIAVTHFSTEQKINSKYRIIEINAKNEEDFEPIKSKCLSINNSNVKFKNFKAETINCDGNCKNPHIFLILDKEGKCLLKPSLNLKQIKECLAKNGENIAEYKILTNDDCGYSRIFINAVATFAQENCKIKNCFICRYHADNTSLYDDTKDVPIFCKSLKVKCNSNKAVTCERFRKEESYVKEILQGTQEYENEIYLDEKNDE